MILAIMIFIFTGCATYSHQYKTAHDFEVDKRQCFNEANQLAANFGAAGNYFIIISETNKCLELKGWYKYTK